jgi:hypothetical protein
MVKKLRALKKSATDFFFDPLLTYFYGAFTMLLVLHYFG